MWVGLCLVLENEFCSEHTIMQREVDIQNIAKRLKREERKTYEESSIPLLKPLLRIKAFSVA